MAGGILAGLASICLAQLPADAVAQSASADLSISYSAAGEPVQATVNADRAFLDIDFNQHADFAVVRISGPDLFSISKRVENTNYLTVDLMKDFDISAYVDGEIDKQAVSGLDYLPDGQYTFEIMVHSGDGKRHTTRGKFEVYAGSAFMIPSFDEISADDKEVSDIRKPGFFQGIAGSVLDFVIPSAHAGDNVDDFINVNDTQGDDSVGISLYNATAENTEFSIRNEGGNLRIFDDPGVPAPDATTLLNIVGSTGKVGFGTQNPQATMHLVTPNTLAGFRLDDSQGSWQISTGGIGGNFGFRIQDIGDGTSPFRIDSGAPTNSIRVAANGDVGLGTATPSVNLDIVDTARAAVAMNAGADQQADFTLATGNVDRWVFRARAVSNNFEIARRDSGGGFLDVPLLIPYSDGVTQIRNGMTHIPTTTPAAPGGGAATVFVDSSNGDLRVIFSNGTIRTLATN